MKVNSWALPSCAASPDIGWDPRQVAPSSPSGMPSPSVSWSYGSVGKNLLYQPLPVPGWCWKMVAVPPPLTADSYALQLSVPAYSRRRFSPSSSPSPFVASEPSFGSAPT